MCVLVLLFLASYDYGYKYGNIDETKQVTNIIINISSILQIYSNFITTIYSNYILKKIYVI